MVPTQLGPYSIGPRLGRGGMGAVYEAVDSFGGEAVAIKVLATHLADDAGLRRRFDAEIETLKNLRHPGIVRLLAFGEEDGQPYYAMELVRGRSIDALLRSGRRFTWQETVAAALAITRALKVAHDHGVIHRDLKPANLLLPDDAPLGDVKLADFGIAKLFGGAAHTALGNVVGTAEYMAPEQAAGRPIDARADLYALGLVMYAMLAGKPPFRSANVAEVMRMQQVAQPPGLASLVADLPPAVDDLIQKLLAKDAADRPANALALGRLLASIETQASAPPPQTPPPVVLDEGATPRGTTHAARASAKTAALPAAPAAGREHVDLLAPTRDLTQAGPAHPAVSHLAADVAAATTQVDAGARSRHMTLAQLESERAAAVDRQARQEWRMGMLWAAAILFLLVGGSYVLLRPLTADELMTRIEAQLAVSPDRQDALRDVEPLIGQFLARYPGDQRSAAMSGLKRELDIDRLRIRAERREKKSVPPVMRIERDYRQALEQKTADPAACLAALKAILALPDDTAAMPLGDMREADPMVRDTALWRGLVAWQIAQIAAVEAAEQRIDRQDAARTRP